MPIHLPFVTCQQQSPIHSRNHERFEDRQVLGDLGDSCWPSNLMETSRRRRPHLTSSMRTVPADRPSPLVSSWADFESDGPTNLYNARKVRVSDAELVQRAYNASRASRRGRLLRVPSVMWDCKEISGFAMLSRQTGAAGENFEVLTTGEVACEPSDIEPLLRPQSESDYNAVARDFLGDQFIYGSIVHEVQPRGFDSDYDDTDDEFGSESFRLHTDNHVAVRTACFARSRRFARNEEWCFLEHFRPRSVAPASPFATFGSSESSTSSVNIDDLTGFTIVMSSMPESELTAGKMKKERVTQLHGITAAYLVEPLPETVGCRGPRVRVSFHATFTATKTRKGYADSQIVRARLMSLAKSLHRLPDLIERRQRQTSAFNLRPSGSLSCRSGLENRRHAETRNSHCVACSKRLRMRLLNAPTRRSKRCQICLYRACASCWSKQNVETFGGHNTNMVVCRRCHESFGSSEYSHLALT